MGIAWVCAGARLICTGVCCKLVHTGRHASIPASSAGSKQARSQSRTRHKAGVWCVWVGRGAGDARARALAALTTGCSASNCTGMTPCSRRSRSSTARSMAVAKGCHSSKAITPSENRSTCVWLEAEVVDVGLAGTRWLPHSWQGLAAASAWRCSTGTCPQAGGRSQAAQAGPCGSAPLRRSWPSPHESRGCREGPGSTQQEWGGDSQPGSLSPMLPSPGTRPLRPAAP